MKFYSLLIISILACSQPFSTAAADKYTEKMEQHYGRELSYQMYEFDNGWWGGTVYQPGVGCTDTVYLSTRWYGTNSQLWKYTLAHEWAHVMQGEQCNKPHAESAAEAMALAKLVQADEWCAVEEAMDFLIDVKGWNLEKVNAIINLFRSRLGFIFYPERA